VVPPRSVSGDQHARGFKALGEGVRLRLLSLMAAAGAEVCACDLSVAFDLTGPTISHHLKVLREAGLVECRRRGTWVYYQLRTDRLRGLADLLDATVDAAAGDPTTVTGRR
jgi:ArsR family transcriptional regulator